MTDNTNFSLLFRLHLVLFWFDFCSIGIINSQLIPINLAFLTWNWKLFAIKKNLYAQVRLMMMMLIVCALVILFLSFCLFTILESFCENNVS